MTSQRERIRQRAEFRCEYCRLPEAATPFITFHVEHVIAKQHIEDDSLDNLALACDRCNAFKGPNLSSIDPDSHEIVELFHPRRNSWTEHFRFDGPLVVGLSQTGRATVRLLNMNARRRVDLRQNWLETGNEL